MNVQRKVIYAERRTILEGSSVRENILNFIEALVGNLVEGFCSTEVRAEEWDLTGLLEEVRAIIPLPPELSESALRALDAAGIKEQILTAALAAYEAKVAS